MADEPPSPILDRELTTDIVAAYVRRNQIRPDQLPVLISTVHKAQRLGNRWPNSTESDHPPSRSGDPSTAIMSFASNAGGAARCSGGMSRPAMD